jgi:hypothetical protein
MLSGPISGVYEFKYYDLVRLGILVVQLVRSMN